MKAHRPDSEEEVERKPSDSEPLACLAFKIATDPFVGKLTYVRVYSGVLESGGPSKNMSLQLKSRRVGGATYQIPVEVREEKGIGIAMRWIRDSARGRKGRSMQERLAEELKDAYNGTGPAVKKREEVHRMAEANRAFSHYRW